MKRFPKLGNVMDADDWEWLQRENPRLAACLEAEVIQGAEPDDIERFIVGDYGNNREKLARRLRSAARYLKEVVRA